MPRALIFGEILFDVYPGYKRLGGAPFNFAYHLHQFGLEVTFISRIGEDEAGREILDRLAQCGFPAHAVQRDPDHPTGTVVVTLKEEGIPSFRIVEQAAYDFVTADTRALPAAPPEVVYFGTLAQRHAVSRQALRTILQHSGPPALVFCDLNLRQSFYTPEILRDSLRASNVLKLNAEELVVVQQHLQLAASEEAAAQQLMQQFDIGCVCITKGGAGSVLYGLSQKAVWPSHGQQTIEVHDTVGAGDAYAAVLAFGLLAQWPLPVIVERASQKPPPKSGITPTKPKTPHQKPNHTPKHS